MDAKDTLDAALELFCHQNALDARRRGGGLRAFQQQGMAGANRVGVGDVEQDATDFGFVDDVGREDFHHYREAETLCRGNGFFDRCAGGLRRRGNARGGKQKLCLGFRRGGGR